jgi:class 3 adenylate cyclase
MVAITRRAAVDQPVIATALRAAFTDQARRGVLVAMAVRTLLMAAALVEAVALTIPGQQFRPQFFRIPAATTLFWIGLGVIDLVLFIAAARSKAPLFWCFVCMAIDLGLTIYGKFFYLLYVMKTIMPLFIMVRYQDVMVMPILIALYSLPLSARLLWTTGVGCMAAWLIGILYDFKIYGVGHLYWGPFGPGVDDARLRMIMDPTVLLPDYFGAQIALIGLFTVFLWLSTRACERHIAAKVQAEDNVLTLARFFPPKVAEALTSAGTGRLAPARRTVAILFVASPKAGIDDPTAFALLQRQYSLIETAIFAHNGVIDRFTGGPVMGAFGALTSDPDAVLNGLACARDILRSRSTSFQPVLSLHVGEAVCGEMGDDDNRAFSIVGDTVNVASRMLDEAQARGASLLLSEAAAERIVGAGLGGDLVEAGDFQPRGREGAVALWALRLQ